MPLAAQRLARGVYKAPYLVHGLEVLFAVDRHGVARKHLKLTHVVTEEGATRLLEAWLDRIDPPAVRLVDEPPASPARATWPYDHEALPPRTSRPNQMIVVEPIRVY